MSDLWFSHDVTGQRFIYQGWRIVFDVLSVDGHTEDRYESVTLPLSDVTFDDGIPQEILRETSRLVYVVHKYIRRVSEALDPEEGER